MAEERRRARPQPEPPFRELLIDPIEEDTRIQPLLLQADHLAEEELVGVDRGRGFCHRFWRTKQRILKERFRIVWFTPQEMNPDNLFD